MIVVLIFLAVDAAVFDERMEQVRAGRGPVLNALDVFAKGTRKYFGVATVFGGIVAVIDGAALLILGIPAAGLWALLAFVTNYIPNIGFIIGLIPPVILGLLVGGPSLAITVLVVYCVVNFIIQSVLQPKFVGDAVGLTTTVSFLSLIVWAYILGPIGAILAIPASLFFKALLVDMDPRREWLGLFLGDKPVFKDKKREESPKMPPDQTAADSGSPLLRPPRTGRSTAAGARQANWPWRRCTATLAGLRLAAGLPAGLDPCGCRCRPDSLGGAGSGGAGLRDDRRCPAGGRAVCGDPVAGAVRGGRQFPSSGGGADVGNRRAVRGVGGAVRRRQLHAVCGADRGAGHRHRDSRPAVRAAPAGLHRVLHLRAGAEGLHRRAGADHHDRPGAEILRCAQGRGRLLPAGLGGDQPSR